MRKLEVIATCIEDVRNIVAGGGNRIELVSALTEGGLTPSIALIEHAARAAGDVPVMVMIRPHAMSFCYSKADINVMVSDIMAVRNTGAAGIVMGALTENGEIDRDAMDQLMCEVGELEITFHKAIDSASNIMSAIDIIREEYPSVTRILTGGGLGPIDTNVKTIKQMRERAGKSIEIVAGGGITLSNICTLIQADAATGYHVGTSVRVNKSPLGPVDKKLVAECVKLLKG